MRPPLGLLGSLACLTACLAACDEKASADAPAPSSRVNAVAAAPASRAEAPQDFCDVWREAGEPAPDGGTTQFAYPPLDAEAPPAGDGWRWINVWATWCEPCVEELPRLAEWETALGPAGLSDVVFVSVDETAEVVEAFRKAHPGAPASLRVTDAATVPAWIGALGLDPGAPLPIHVFVDPEGEVRCLRVAEIAESDLPAVRRLLGS